MTYVEGEYYRLCMCSGVARVQRLPGHLVGVAMCDHKVNFDPGFETAYM